MSTVHTEIRDAGPDFADRYTVFMEDGSVLGVGDRGNYPNAFCMWLGDETRIKKANCGKLVLVKDLPKATQKAIRDAEAFTVPEL